MSRLCVALLQLLSPGLDPGRALLDGEAACRRAAAMGADVALFPEMWQIGYALHATGPGVLADQLGLATTPDGPFVSHFQNLAHELQMAIVITYLESANPGPRNAATLIDREGVPILSYAKVHTCDFNVEACLVPGRDFPTAELRTANDSVRVGIMICHDREFPEAARELMLGGAELILTPNACLLDPDRLCQFRARAFENMVAVAMANYAQTPGGVPRFDSDFNGHSVAYEGICSTPSGEWLDQTALVAGHEEEVHVVSLDLDALRSYRARGVWGDAYRKPYAYRRSPGCVAVQAIFRRTDSRRDGP
jgi:predicted amidohydrolase